MNKGFTVHMVDFPEEVHYHIKDGNIFINSMHYASADEWARQFLGLEATA